MQMSLSFAQTHLYLFNIILKAESQHFYQV